MNICSIALIKGQPRVSGFADKHMPDSPTADVALVELVEGYGSPSSVHCLLAGMDKSKIQIPQALNPIRAFMIAYTILRVPYYTCSIMNSKTPFLLLRPLHEVRGFGIW